MKNKIFVGLSVIFLFAVCLYAVNLKYEQKKQESYETKLYKNFCDTQKGELKQAEYSKKYNIYKEIDFSSDKKPTKEIFQNLILKNENLTLEEYKKELLKFPSSCYIRADEVDLNNDGKKEIIGYNSCFCNVLGCRGFVLQNQNNEWKNIASFYFAPCSKILILEDKTKNYKNIAVTAKDRSYFKIDSTPNKVYFLKYENGYKQETDKNAKIIQKDIEYIQAQKVYKKIDFSSDKKHAKEIFQNFILKNENLTLEEYKKLCDEGSSFCYSKVNETDLNNDGVSEIIGYNKAYCNLGLSECRGFILQKKKNEWVKISEFNFIPALEIDILQTKNGGFFDIRPNSKFEKNSPFEKYWNKTYIMTYKNGNYENYVYIK